MGRWAYWLIAAAAVLWGIIALFVKGLAAWGLSPLQVVAVRVASIFGKLALRRYEPLTVTTHTFIFAAAAVLPFSGLWEQRALLAAWQVWGYAAGLGLVSTVLAYLLYTVGLKYVEPGRAAVTATLEPLVAATVGMTVFGEALTGWQLTGMALVIAAVAGVQERAG
jgi:drug/metabolite transporter (DMT)-like permease